MIEKLKIARFKTLRNVELDFGLVNLFIGGNGTGKSNLLEAVGLTSASLGRGLGDSDLRSKGLRITPPTLMKSSFKDEKLPKTLELEAQFSGEIEYKAVLQSRENDPLLRFFSEACKFHGNKVFGRSNRGASASGVSHANRLDPNRGIWDQIKATYENIPAEVSDAFSEFSRFAIYTPQTDFLRGRQSGSVDMPPIGLHGEGLSEAVSSYLTTLNRLKRLKTRGKLGDEAVDQEIIQSCSNLVWIPGWASQYGVHRAAPKLTSRDLADRGGETVYFVDQFMHASRNHLSVYDSSEGTLFLLFAAIVLAHPDAPRIFAMDNLDNALNPMLTRKLAELMIKVTGLAVDNNPKLGARQVFLTSHNPTALDAFDLFDERQRVFVVRRNEKGHTIVDRLKPPPGMTRKEWQLSRNGRNLSQIWLDGDIPGALGSKI